jgi:hypothetical protein
LGARAGERVLERGCRVLSAGHVARHHRLQQARQVASEGVVLAIPLSRRRRGRRRSHDALRALRRPRTGLRSPPGSDAAQQDSQSGLRLTACGGCLRTARRRLSGLACFRCLAARIANFLPAMVVLDRSQASTAEYAGDGHGYPQMRLFFLTPVRRKAGSMAAPR